MCIVSRVAVDRPALTIRRAVINVCSTAWADAAFKTTTRIHGFGDASIRPITSKDSVGAWAAAQAPIANWSSETVAMHKKRRPLIIRRLKEGLPGPQYPILG